MRIVVGAVFALFSSPCGGGGLIAGGTADPPEAFSLPAGDEGARPARVRPSGPTVTTNESRRSLPARGGGTPGEA